MERQSYAIGIAASADPAFAGQGHAIATLTPTQIKVMEGVHSGLLNKQIAFHLGIAEKTVKAHMTALMRKLNVRNRTQVAVAAQAFLRATSDESRREEEARAA